MPERHDSESSSHDSHDSCDENSYKKKCYCQKCVRQYDEWLKRNKERGHTTCKRKCFTVCEYVCTKTSVRRKDWGFAREFETRWSPYKGHVPHARDCDKGEKRDHHKKPCDKKRHDRSSSD